MYFIISPRRILILQAPLNIYPVYTHDSHPFQTRPQTLRNPEPDSFQEVPRHGLGPGSLEAVNLGLATPQVHLARLHEPGPLDELVAEEEAREDRDVDVGREEGLGAELAGEEGVVAVGDGHEEAEADGEVRQVRLQRGPVVQAVAGDAVVLEALVEAHVDGAGRGPHDQRRHGRQVREPEEDLLAAVVDVQVAQARQRRRRRHARVRDPEPLEPQDPGRLAVQRRRVQHPRRRVEEGVARRPRRRQHHGVDDRRQGADPAVLDGDDEGRGGRARGRVVDRVQEPRVLGRHAHGDEEHGQHVEDQDTPKDATNGLGNVTAWVLCLTSRDDDHLAATVRERGLGEDAPEGEEAAERPADQVLVHGAGIAPVPEPDSTAVRGAPARNDEHQQYQPDDGDQLDGAEDELGLAVDADREAVDEDHRGEEHRDQRCFGHVVRPEVDDHDCDCHFDGDSDGELIPLVDAS